MRLQSFVLASTLALTPACTRDRRVNYNGHNYLTDCNPQSCTHELQDCSQIEQTCRESEEICRESGVEEAYENAQQLLIEAKNRLRSILEDREKTLAIAISGLNDDSTNTNIFNQLRSNFAVMILTQSQIISALTEQIARQAPILRICREHRTECHSILAACDRNHGYCHAEQAVCQ